MIKHNQDGAVGGIGISLILTIVLLVAAISFGAWAYSGRQDYKNNSDQKVAAAVTVAKQQESTEKDKQFAETEKQPLKTYTSPASLGSISLQFPKTWSGLVDEADSSSSSSATLNAYFYPNVVPSVTSSSSTFALRMQIVPQSYASVLQQLSSLTQNREKPTKITPYALPKLPNVVGVQVNGTLPNQKTGLMVVVPLRSQTLELWTEGSQFTSDFNNNIMPNFTFSP